MMNDAPGWFLVLTLSLSLGAAACGGGSGSGAGGTHGDTPCDTSSTPPDPTEPSASTALQSMLVGHWMGDMSGEADYDLVARADGTCDWIVDLWYSDDPPVERSGTWSVFGADKMPSFDAPWILRLAPNATDPEATAATYRIVTISSDGFTVYDDIEGNDAFMEMEKAP